MVFFSKIRICPIIENQAVTNCHDKNSGLKVTDTISYRCYSILFR